MVGLNNIVRLSELLFFVPSLLLLIYSLFCSTSSTVSTLLFQCSNVPGNARAWAYCSNAEMFQGTLVHELTVPMLKCSREHSCMSLLFQCSNVPGNTRAWAYCSNAQMLQGTLVHELTVPMLKCSREHSCMSFTFKFNPTEWDLHFAHSMDHLNFGYCMSTIKVK